MPADRYQITKTAQSKRDAFCLEYSFRAEHHKKAKHKLKFCYNRRNTRNSNAEHKTNKQAKEANESKQLIAVTVTISYSNRYSL